MDRSVHLTGLPTQTHTHFHSSGNVRGRDHEEEQDTNDKINITNTVAACTRVVFLYGRDL